MNRRHQLVVFVNEDEITKLKKMAEEDGTHVSVLVRQWIADEWTARHGKRKSKAKT